MSTITIQGVKFSSEKEAAIKEFLNELVWSGADGFPRVCVLELDETLYYAMKIQPKNESNEAGDNLEWVKAERNTFFCDSYATVISGADEL